MAPLLVILLYQKLRELSNRFSTVTRCESCQMCQGHALWVQAFSEDLTLTPDVTRVTLARSVTCEVSVCQLLRASSVPELCSVLIHFCHWCKCWLANTQDSWWYYEAAWKLKTRSPQFGFVSNRGWSVAANHIKLRGYLCSTCPFSLCVCDSVINECM